MSNKDKDTNKIDRDKLLDVARAAGLAESEQTAYYKFSLDDGPAKIYIAKTKKVSRIDLSGFTLEHAGIKILSDQDRKDLKLGKVSANVDFTQPEETILEALSAACEVLKAVKAPEKPAKKPKAEKKAKAVETEDEGSNGESELDAEAKAARLELIKQAARKKALEASAGAQ